MPKIDKLLDAEYQVIRILLGNHEPMTLLDLLNEGQRQGFNINASHKAVKRLLEAGCIVKSNSFDDINRTRFNVTRDGECLAAAFEQEANDRTKRERQQRFQNQISVLNLLVPLVTFVLGVLVEHFAGVISLVMKLVH